MIENIKIKKYTHSDGDYFYHDIYCDSLYFHGLYNYYSYCKKIGYHYKNQQKGFWLKEEKR